MEKQPPRLLPELLPLVFKDQDELRSVALVCKAWTAAAQAELFRVIATDYWGEIEGFNQHFTAHPKLGSLVKEIRVIANLVFQDPNHDGVSCDQLATLFSLTPNVRILNLGNVVVLGDTEEKMLASLKHVEELTLFSTNIDEVYRYEMGAFAQLLSVWTHLRKLELHNVLFRVRPLQDVPLIAPPRFATLDLFGSRFVDDELEWFVSKSEGSLKNFEYVEPGHGMLELRGSTVWAGGIGSTQIECLPAPHATPSGLIRLVEQVGSSLASLHLGVQTLKPVHVANMLSHTPQLKSLAIPFISFDPTILAPAPRSLGRLQLYILPESKIFTPEATEAVAALLKQADFSSLKKLVISKVFEGKAYLGFADDLREIAEATGLAIWLQDRYFHYWLDELPLDKFLADTAAGISPWSS